MIANYADHSSNERTFLAWVRTSASIVGFGLAASRLGNDPAPLWSEIALLLSGGVVILVAYFRMRHIRSLITARELFSGEKLPEDSFLMVLIAALFGLLGIFVFHVR